MSRKKWLLVQVVAVCFLSLVFLDKVKATSKSWEYVQFGGNTSFEYLTFVDENRIVAATTGRPYYISGGNISLSTDGGKSWSTTLQTVPANTQKIRFLNSQVGFAVGGGEGFGVAMYLGKTTDGGSTWTDLSENFIKSVGSSTYIPLYGLWIMDSSTIYVSSSGQVYVSRDGGTTWGRAGDVYAINPDQYIHGNLQFPTASVGFVSSDNYLFRTQNGGSSWEKLTPPWNSKEYKTLKSLKFLDANNGWALVVDNILPDAGAFLYRTTDGGKSWSLVYQWVGWIGSNYSGPTPEAFYVKSANDLWAGGWEEIWHSSDGGATWTLENEGDLYIRVWEFQTAGSESAPRAIASTGMSDTGIYGYYKYTGTTTTGQGWQEVTISAPAGLWDVDFVSNDLGWVVGYDGFIAKSTNGGASWTSQTSGTSTELRDVDFVSEKNGWVAGINGVILHTSDGGTTWQSQTHNSIWWTSIAFVDENRGWVAGDYGIIEATATGGTKWAQQYQHPQQLDWWGLFFYDANNGWAVGESGAIAHTSNGGFGWSLQSSGTSQNLRDISAVSANKVWVVGDSGTILYSSAGGASWTAQSSGTTQNLNGVHFFTESNGIAVGGSGNVLETTNGGTTWTKQDFPTTGGLNEISATDSSHRWIVSGKNVYRYTTTGTTTSLSDICCGMEGGVSVNSGSYSSEVNVGQSDKVDIKAAIKSSVTGTGDIYVVVYWEGFYFFKIGDPDQWWSYDGTKVIPYKGGVSLSGYSLSIYSGLLTGLKGDLRVFVVYWEQGKADPVISDPLVIHMK